MDTWGKVFQTGGAASAKALGQHELGSFQRHRAAKASGRVSGEGAGAGEVPLIQGLVSQRTSSGSILLGALGMWLSGRARRADAQLYRTVSLKVERDVLEGRDADFCTSTGER